MRTLLPFLLGSSLFSMGCLVAPEELPPERRGDGVGRTNEPPSTDEGQGDADGDADEGRGDTGGGVPVPEPSRPGFYAKAMLAGELSEFGGGGSGGSGSGGSGGASSDGGDEPTSSDDPFSDPNRLLVFLSSEAFACADPFGTSVCTTDRTSWSLQFTLWPQQQRPGRYDLLDINGGFFETIPDPNLNCGGGGGTAMGVVVIDAIDTRSVRFHFEKAQLFASEVEQDLLSKGPFVAERCR